MPIKEFIEVPFHEYCFGRCPRPCEYYDGFWNVPKVERWWNYKLAAIDFGETKISPCKLDTSVKEARLLWQSNYLLPSVLDDMNKEIANIECKLKKFLDSRVTIEGIGISSKHLTFRFSMLCPIWCLREELEKKYGRKKMSELVKNGIEDLLIEVTDKLIGDEQCFRFRVINKDTPKEKGWWELSPPSLMNILIIEMKLVNKVMPPLEIPKYRSDIENYLETTYSDWVKHP